ncbi:MAG: hypothetical protein ACRD0X_00585 [Thermoanaerobaculia bacterium]
MEPVTPAPPKKKMGVLGWIVIGCLGLVVVAGVVFVGGVWFVGKKVKGVVEDFEQDPVRAAAEFAVKMNPELELVAVDDGAKTMTIREKATGKELTVDWSQISQGQFRFEADGEEMTIEASPSEQGGRLKIEADGKEVTIDAVATEQGGVVTIQDGAGEAQATLTAGGVADAGLDWFPRYPGASALAVNYTTRTGEARNDYFTFTTSDAVEQVLDFYDAALKKQGFETSKSSFSTNDQPGGTILGWTADQGHTFTLVAGREGEATQVGVNSNRKP